MTTSTASRVVRLQDTGSDGDGRVSSTDPARGWVDLYDVSVTGRWLPSFRRARTFSYFGKPDATTVALGSANKPPRLRDFADYPGKPFAPVPAPHAAPVTVNRCVGRMGLDPSTIHPDDPARQTHASRPVAACHVRKDRCALCRVGAVCRLANSKG